METKKHKLNFSRPSQAVAVLCLSWE